MNVDFKGVGYGGEGVQRAPANFFIFPGAEDGYLSKICFLFKCADRNPLLFHDFANIACQHRALLTPKVCFNSLVKKIDIGNDDGLVRNKLVRNVLVQSQTGGTYG